MLKPAFRLVSLLCGVCVSLLLSSGATAQTTSIGEGLVYAFDKTGLVLYTTRGQYFNYSLEGDYAITWYQSVHFVDLKPGDVVGVLVQAGADGGMEAGGIHVYRNQPQDVLDRLAAGTGPLGPFPGALVTGVLQSLSAPGDVGDTLTLLRGGQATTFKIGAYVYPEAISPATLSDIGAGFGSVRVIAKRQPDGRLVPSSIELHFSPAASNQVAGAVAAANDLKARLDIVDSDTVIGMLGSLRMLQYTTSQQDGEIVLDAVTALLGALERKLTDKGEALTPAQNEALRIALANTLSASVRFLEDATIAFRPAVVRDFGEVVTSMLNLGVVLNSAEAYILPLAADAQSDPVATLDAQLSTAIRLTPTNQGLIAPNALAAALSNPGIAPEELNAIHSELTEALNPADVRVEGFAGDTALADAFAAAFPGQNTDIAFDPRSGVLQFSLPQAERVIPARATSMAVVAEDFPQGIHTLADGSMVFTSDRLAAVVTPAPYDPIAFYADARALGRVSLDERGALTIATANFTVAASFDFSGISIGAPHNGLTYQISGAGDESNTNHIIKVTYGDGTTQKLQPFVAAEGLFESLAARHIALEVNRNTGVMSVNGASFRPSYFIEPLDAPTQAFWNANKDAQGLAYRGGDLNGDGRADYEVISSAGTQAVYAVP